MQGNDLKQKQKSACSTKTVAVPQSAACVKCGDDVELWTDEDETLCPGCGHRIFRKETTVH